MSRAVNLLIALVMACGGAGTSNHVVSPRGEGFTVQLPAAAFLDQLDDRERRDQLRDWGVLATLSHEGATPEQTAAATYQMPAARLPYLDELYTFTYGRGRRAYFGERVLLFVDADDPDRVATLGRLADQVRMELGEVPERAEIYVVEDQRNAGTLYVTRSRDVEGARLFSASYGYAEAEVADESQLAAWLSKVDDLSRVRIEADRLVLGGRRFAATRTEGVTIDDIAAVYQGGKRIQDRQADAQHALEGLDDKYKAEARRRMAAAGFVPGRNYSEAELARASQLVQRIRAELRVKAEVEVKEILHRASGPREPGFSLDPRWLPSPDGEHPRMLARLEQLAADPCGEIARIGRLAPQLLAEQPDETRRSGEAWSAEALADLDIPAATCTWLRDVIGKQLAQVADALETASPEEWRAGFVPYFQLRKELEEKLAELPSLQRAALAAVLGALSFYEFETGAQCARYDEMEGTAAAMTLFYTDLLAKLWQSVDYGHSAPTLAIPGFLSRPRLDLSPTFADEVQRLRNTRIWFGPRADGASRTVSETGPELAFLHRFSRVYAAGSDPAKPGQESMPNEASRMSIGWWDRHFDEVADHEQQYHRQNQIMKWSAVTAAMLQAPLAPTFLADVRVDRSARFFPWLAGHRDQLRFKESVPERRTPYSTECVALLHSYPFQSTGNIRIITGGVSLAGREAAEATPTVNLKLPPGQRVVPPPSVEPVPVRALEGRTVSLKNADAARTRAGSGSIQLHDVSARFEGDAGAQAITLDSAAGKLTTVRLDRAAGGIRIDVRAGPVENVRAALDRGGGGVRISFEAEPETTVWRGETLVEVQRVARLSPDGSVTAVAHDTFGPGWRQARAADASEVHARMDGYEWQVVRPGARPTEPPSMHFRNEPPPASAREVQIVGVDGVTTGRVTSSGELFLARPSSPGLRAGWRDLSERLEVSQSLQVAPGAKARLDLSQLARGDRLEQAVPRLEQAVPGQPYTLQDRARAALSDVMARNATAARQGLAELTARGAKVSPETRGMLVDRLRTHGDADVAAFVEGRLQGKPAPDRSLVEDRGRVTVKWEPRRIETFEVRDAEAGSIPPVKYFDSHLLVGKEEFEPDFSGSIKRWVNDPSVRVREMKANPVEPNPGMIVDRTTKQVLLRTREPAAERIPDALRSHQRVFLIMPRTVTMPDECDDRRKDDRRKDVRNCGHAN